MTPSPSPARTPVRAAARAVVRAVVRAALVTCGLARAGAAQSGGAVVDTAVVLPAGFGPEGVAPGPDARSFWVSSMRTGRVVLVARDGPARPPRELRSAAFGAGWSALGLAAVPARSALWVAATAMPQALGYDSTRAAGAALVELDLRTGAVRRRVAAPAGVMLGDVAVHADGRVFAADARSGAVWVWRPGARALVALVAPGTLRSAQGLAITRDGRSLVVADYARGLARVDLASGAVIPLAPAAALPARTLRGVDGVQLLPARHGADVESYAAVQNGAPPGRVVRVDVRGDSVVGIAPVLDGHPALADPTLLALLPGASGGPELLLVAASLWPFLGDDGRTRGTPTPTAILRLRLPTP